MQFYFHICLAYVKSSFFVPLDLKFKVVGVGIYNPL